MILKIKNKNTEKLILNNLDLVRFIVDRLCFKLPAHIEKKELISIGCLGLIDAAQKYDPQKKCSFSTYANFRIKGTILDSLRKNKLGGQALCKKIRKLENAMEIIKNKKNAPATDKEIATFLKIKETDLQELYSEIYRSNYLSLDTSFNNTNTEGMNKLDTICSVHDHTNEVEMQNVLSQALNKLAEKEKSVLTHYYYEGLSLKEIGSVLSLTESRISQLHTKAILKLRKTFQSWVTEI
ncbi:FliA/WhiG family RNA polymerase sigma factor [bacterium]|jgi:RNA polymerase sigma factor FliA|nr:FliA/WhiG family RNA polymerase sigma factor [bacterium]MBT3580877.1 FliA/WhiG family RNA polymerase sigma factor [bacterium]MBT4552443.1 FliA/WhiG family RNA polymerase sigma factor [bacterium]